MWEIQHFTLCDGWVNTWTEDDGSPTRFVYKHEAEAALEDFLLLRKDEVTEYRIARVD